MSVCVSNPLPQTSSPSSLHPVSLLRFSSSTCSAPPPSSSHIPPPTHTHKHTSISKVFPAFRAFLTDSSKEKRTALIDELKKVEDFLQASGKKRDGPLFGGLQMDATDAAFAPRLYHITVMLFYKVKRQFLAGPSSPVLCGVRPHAHTPPFQTPHAPFLWPPCLLPRDSSCLNP